MFRVNLPQKIFQSRAIKEVKHRINEAIAEPGGILAIIGEIGIGKTIAAIEALGTLEEFGHHIIWCRQLDKENLKIGIICNAMVRYFGESPRKDIDARTEQLRRLLGQAIQNDKKVILVIDEAHALHTQTLRALKRLLELNFARQIGLLSIILIAQPSIYEKFNILDEVTLRTDILEMRGLTKEESREFLKFICDWNHIKITDEVAEYLSTRSDIPLRLVVTLDRIAEIQHRLGATLTVKQLKEQFLHPLREKISSTGMTIRQVAQKTGYSPAAVSQVLAGKYQGDAKQVIQEIEKVFAGGIK